MGIVFSVISRSSHFIFMRPSRDADWTEIKHYQWFSLDTSYFNEKFWKTSSALSQTLTRKLRTEKNILVETMLVIALLGVSLVLAYEESYQGFNDCGVDGWSCDAHEKGKYEITYKCPANHPNARVWIWTTRLPTGATIFTVRDCNHLEVHFDCTKGLRTTLLRQFNVINVTILDILPPLLPGVFLHDNGQIPQAPPGLSIMNVKKIKLYPGVFDKPAPGCRYQFLELVSLSLENVHIDKLSKGLFHNQNMDKFVMKDVVIDEIEGNAMTVAADTYITGTTFPNIPNGGISLRGESISFINNTFKKIETLGLTIKTKDLVFSKNAVEEINMQGLEVLGANIEITKNTFTHLETGAFQRVTPGYSPLTYEIASKFVYNFSENVVKNINPGSIHLNWEVYKKVCAQIIFENNLFECSCLNFGWMSVSNGLGPKISKVKEFYNTYLTKEVNRCSGHSRCPLNAVVAQIQDVCGNKTDVSTICASFDTASDSYTTAPLGEETVPASSSVQQTTKAQQDLKIYESDTQRIEKQASILSDAENEISQLETRGFPVWFIIVPIIILLTAVSLGVFIYWYKKKKQRQMVTTVYKNQKGADADNLIVVNELHNELYKP